MEGATTMAGLPPMPKIKIMSISLGIALIAVACSGSGDHLEAADISGSSSGLASTAADIAAPDPAATQFGSDKPVAERVLLPALDASADSTPSAVAQIASTGREDFPSALDDFYATSFPPPLIDPEEILSGGPPPDGIPPIDEPKFQSAKSVDWLFNLEPVLSIEVNGEVRGYPIQIMTWHEIVNDTIAGVPVTISYCPLCNSALAYDRRVGERIFDFGTSGKLFNSSLVMYDRQTESLWTHFEGKAVVGALTGERLTTLPVATTSWESFRDAHPDALVLSRLTGFRRDYGRNPYAGYDDVNTSPFLFNGVVDGRLAAKTRVVVVVRSDDGPAVALPLESLFDQRVVQFTAQGRDVVAVLERGASSALDESDISAGYDQGSTGVFLADLQGEKIDLVSTDEGFLDKVSGITFDVFGVATDGSGTRLEPVEHLDTFWFAIGSFDPDVEVIGL